MAIDGADCERDEDEVPPDDGVGAPAGRRGPAEGTGAGGFMSMGGTAMPKLAKLPLELNEAIGADGAEAGGEF